MAYSAMSTLVYLDTVTADEFGKIRTNFVWLASLLRNGTAISGLSNSSELMPEWGARAYNSGNVLHTNNGGWFAMTFNTQTYDTDGIWEGVTNPTRFTATRAGKYAVFGCVSWANSATGMRGIRAKVNGTTWAEHYSVAGTGVTTSIATVVTLTAAQYVEFDGFQNSGGNLNMNANGNFGVQGAIQWMGV